MAIEADRFKEEVAATANLAAYIEKLERALHIAATEYAHDLYEPDEDEDITADIEKVKSEWLEQAGGGDDGN